MALSRTSWTKGRSGNPRGRPRSGKELGPILREVVDPRRFAEKLCELCYAGDVQAMRLLLLYTDGLPAGRAEVEGAEGIQINVIYSQQNNQINVVGSSSGSPATEPTGEVTQCRLFRPPEAEDDAGDAESDSDNAKE